MSAPQQVAQTVEKVGLTFAGGSVMWIWLAEHQQAIAALGVMVGIAVGLIGLGVNWYYLHRDSKRRNRRDSDK